MSSFGQNVRPFFESSRRPSKTGRESAVRGCPGCPDGKDRCKTAAARHARPHPQFVFIY